MAYTWDNNGNLLADGVSTYTYNYANMLSSVNQGGVVYTYSYSGLGDRLQQAVDGVPTSYTLDINTGLTQVLTDGTNAYLYGQGRIAQVSTTTEYFLGDALSSVRQLVDEGVAVTLTQRYEPYGNIQNRSNRLILMRLFRNWFPDQDRRPQMNSAGIYLFWGICKNTQSVMFMQEMSDDIESKEIIPEKELVKEAMIALGNLNLQLAVLKNLWDQSQIAKKQLEEIIGLDDLALS